METTSPSLESADPLIGGELGKFRIIERLGVGGMGVVYRAEDTTLGREVALKTLKADRYADPVRRKRLAREARSLALLTHPAIATVYEVGEADGQAFIAMELIEGRTLKQRMLAGAIPSIEAVPMFIEIANALAHAHDNGVIHRDLKPSNVMITSKGSVKLLDFGIAKLLDAEDKQSAGATTHEGEVLGTPAYMSPEQARGDRTDHRSDIFSLGSLMYAAVSGRPPFEEETPYETVVAVYRQQPKHLDEVAPFVPTQLRNLIHRCLRKEPDKRYQRADAVSMDLGLLPVDETMTAAGEHVAVPDPEHAQSQGRSGRGRLMLIGALSFLALATALIVWWALELRDQGERGSSDRARTYEEKRLTTSSSEQPVLSGGFSSDGSVFAYATLTGVWLRRGDEDAPQRVVVPSLEPPFFVDVGHDNSWLLFAGVAEDGTGEVWRVPLGDGRPVRVHSGARVYWLDASPTRPEFLVITASDSASDVHVQSLSPATRRRLHNSSQITTASWSPDGEHVAFMLIDPSRKKMDARGEIWVTARGGHGKKHVVSTSGIRANWGTSSVIWLDESTIGYPTYDAGTTFWSRPAFASGKPRRLHVWLDEQVVVIGGARGGVVFARKADFNELLLATLDTHNAKLFDIRKLPRAAGEIRVKGWLRDGRIVVAQKTGSTTRLLALDPLTNTSIVIADGSARNRMLGIDSNGLYFWREGASDDGHRLYYWDSSSGSERFVVEVPAESGSEVSCARAREEYCLLSGIYDDWRRFRVVTSAGPFEDLAWSYEVASTVVWELSPRGDKVAFVSRAGTLEQVELVSRKLSLLAATADMYIADIEWGGDGELFLNANWVPDVGLSAMLRIAGGGEPVAYWSSNSSRMDGLGISPDGRRVAYVESTHVIDLWALRPSVR